MFSKVFYKALVCGLVAILLFTLSSPLEARTPAYTLVVGVSGAGGNLSLVRLVGREFTVLSLPKSAQLAVLGPGSPGQNLYRDLPMAELVRRMEVALGFRIASFVRFDDTLIVDIVDRLGGLTVGGERHTGKEVLDSFKPRVDGLYRRAGSQIEVARAVLAETLRVTNWVRLPGIVRAIFRNVETDYSLTSALGLLVARPTQFKVVHLDNPAVRYDGHYLPQNLPLPIVVGGRTLVPVRMISEITGATVSWDERFQRVTVWQGRTTIDLVIGQRTIWVNGVPRPLGVSPMIVGGRTMVPFRMILEEFGYRVVWVAEDYVIEVSP